MYRICENAAASSAQAARGPVNDIVDLRCQICHADMLPPSAKHTRLLSVYLCQTHMVHTQCKARLGNRGCQICRIPCIAENEITESMSNYMWKSGLRVTCGCGRSHTREAASECPQRMTMCLFQDCFHVMPLDKTQEHYDEAHPACEIVTQPGCPFKGCRVSQTLETLSAHIKTCEYQPATCVCGQTNPLYLIRTHKLSCSKIKCASSRIINDRFAITIPIGRCTHGPSQRCSIESFIKAIRDCSDEEIDDILTELETARTSVMS